MLSHKKKLLILTVMIIMIAAVALSACSQPTPEVVEKVVTQVVQVTVVVEGTPQVVEKEVTKVVEVEKVVTPTPATVSYDQAPDPTTVIIADSADIANMDPQLAYEGSSFDMLYNVYEGLIFLNQKSASEFVPQLATEVPTVDNGGISADGKTYTFHIRKGVKFHDGSDLTASDVAYSWERGLLQSSPNSGQWMMIEAIMGYGSGDITEPIDDGAYAGDRGQLIANASADDLKAVCEAVKDHFEADDEAGTFTVKLEKPWGPLMAIISQPWAFVIDKDWAVKNGDWDGSCDTWQNFYAPGPEEDPINYIANGTGPYKLDHWTPDEEWVLVANEDYWRQPDDPMWEGGPAGPPKIKRIVHKTVNEWGTRFAMLQAGDVAWATVPDSNRPQVDPLVGEICDNDTGECQPGENPDAPLRMWPNLPSTSRTDIFMNFNVKTDESGSNPYIGSGQLDGNGVPPDFFSDIHVRKAFNYCFDYDTYIEDGQNGEGTRNNGPIIAGMLGYNPDGEMYEFDLDKCAAELEQAWGGQLPEVGFRVQAVTNTGNLMRQTAAAILQSNLRSINKNYRIEIVTLPWPSYLSSFRAGQLPIAISGWGEDYHDPHNWVQPYLIGTFAKRQNTPDDFREIFRPLIEKAVEEPDAAKRAEYYYEIQKLHHENVPQVILSQAGNRVYEQRWVKNFYYNPLASAHRYIYPLSLGGE